MQKVQSILLVVYFECSALIDRVLALIGIIVLLPALGVVAVLFKTENPTWPLFFKQQRVGRYGKLFWVYKLTTLPPEFPQMPTKQMELCKPPIGFVAHFLRQSRLNELPQLWNIVKGEMKFVGPRPVIVEDVGVLQFRKNTFLQDLYPGFTFVDRVFGDEDLSLFQREEYEKQYGFVWNVFFIFWWDCVILFRSFVLMCVLFTKYVRMYEKAKL